MSWVPAWFSGPAWYFELDTQLPARPLTHQSPDVYLPGSSGPHALSPPALPSPLCQRRGLTPCTLTDSSSTVASVRDWVQVIWTLARSRCSINELLLGSDMSPSLRPAVGVWGEWREGPQPLRPPPRASGLFRGGLTWRPNRPLDGWEQPLGGACPTGARPLCHPSLTQCGQWLSSAWGALGTSGG